MKKGKGKGKEKGKGKGREWKRRMEGTGCRVREARGRRRARAAKGRSAKEGVSDASPITSDLYGRPDCPLGLHACPALALQHALHVPRIEVPSIKRPERERCSMRASAWPVDV